jgi:hypothetical protein
MIRRMKRCFLLLLGFLGIAACHGDSHLATDIDAALLQDTAKRVTVPVTIQGKVTCISCDADDGMGIVVTSATMGSVASGLYEGVGNYSLTGTAKSGDTLTIKITLSRLGGVTGKSVTATVPEGGGTILQDFQFQ